MQDFNYVFTNCMEITLDLACNWIPSKKLIQVLLPFLFSFKCPCVQTHWRANKEAMMAYLEEAGKVVRGLVLDRVTRLSSSHPLTSLSL